MLHVSGAKRSAFIVFCSVTASLAAQQPAAPKFEVASVKPSSDTPIPFTGGRVPPNRWMAIRVNIVNLIMVAYPEYAFEGRVIGGPAWIRNERFDIEAVKDPTTTPAQVAPMMAHLLANRFALRTHIEQRPVDVYVLKMAHADGRFGPQLKRSAASCIEARMARQPLPRECRGTVTSGMNLAVNQIADFLGYLSSRQIDRPVIDRTGLTGYLDFLLHYDYGPFNDPFRPAPRTEGVSFFTALEEQLGLKLEPTREVMDVLVIDSVERPTPD